MNYFGEPVFDHQKQVQIQARSIFVNLPSCNKCNWFFCTVHAYTCTEVHKPPINRGFMRDFPKIVGGRRTLRKIKYEYQTSAGSIVDCSVSVMTLCRVELVIRILWHQGKGLYSQLFHGWERNGLWHNFYIAEWFFRSCKIRPLDGAATIFFIWISKGKFMFEYA